MWVIARIDGRNFSTLTKNLEPFNPIMSFCMIESAKDAMDCGFKSLYGYTQSDEISILFHPKDIAFNGKIRKYNSLLASQVTARFCMMGHPATFDCRVIQLPTFGHVVDYFLWRIDDAVNNALNSLCHYTLMKKEKISATAAGKLMVNKHNDWKNEILFKHGINFNDIEAWKKRGIGIYWEMYKKKGHNPITNEDVIADRKRLIADMKLPLGNDKYKTFLNRIKVMVDREI